MITKTIEMTALEAADGYVLTNGSTYSRLVYLGINDSPSNWHEIPESEVPANWDHPELNDTTEG